MKANPNRFWIIVILLGWVFDFLFWKKPLGVNFAIFVTLCLADRILFLLERMGFASHGTGLLLLPLLLLRRDDLYPPRADDSFPVHFTVTLS